MTWPRHLPDGRLVPFLADLMAGRRELAHLRDRGLDHGHFTDDEIAELGASLPDPPPLTDEELALVLAPVQARNRAMRQAQDQAGQGGPPLHPGPSPDPGPAPGPGPGPQRGTTATPDPGEVPSDDGERPRGARSRSASRSKDRVRDENFDAITWWLQNVPDPPDEEWS